MRGGSVAVRRRVVSVEADRGPAGERWRYGSGLLIGGSRVLTAAHVINSARAVTVRRPDGIEWAADLQHSLVGDPERLDLAVLQVPDAEALAPVPVARVSRDVLGGELVEGCWAVGFPAFQEVTRGPGGVSRRETAQVEGKIPPLSGLREGFLSLQVTSSPRPLPRESMLDRSEWSGMSGAAVFAGPLLVGVVTEHFPGRGPSDITVTPLDGLLDPAKAPADADQWWASLGVSNPALLPRLPARPEPTYRATLRVIRQWTPVLLQRDDELARIRAFATGAADAFGSGTEASGYVWFIGGPWSGKTALLAEAVHTPPADVDVVAYFLVARESNASREQFLTAVVPQLAALLDTDIPSVLDLSMFRDLWAQAADRAAGLDRHLLLVVDGLDEDLRPGGLSVAAALPTANLGEHARVLVASRPHPDLPDDVHPQHPLRAVTPVSLSTSPHAAQLRTLAEHELGALLRRDGTGAELAFDVLGLLTAAAGPLSVADLAALIADAKPRAIRALVGERAARSLQPVGAEGRQRFAFAHETLLQSCQSHPDVGGDATYRARVHAWGQQWQTQRWPLSDTPSYLLDSYPATLVEAPDRLAALVCDIAWLHAAIVRTGVDRVLASLRTAAQLLPRDQHVASILRVVQLQAHRIRGGDRAGAAATNLCWEALRLGLWDVARAAAERLRALPGCHFLPVWSTESTSPYLTQTVGAHSRGVAAVAVTADGKIASGGEDGVVLLWDLEAGGDTGQKLGVHDRGVWALAVTAQGQIVSGGGDGLVQIWDPNAPLQVPQRCDRHGGSVFAVSLTFDGKIVAAGDEGVVWLWDPTLPDRPRRALGRHGGVVWALAVTSNGQIVSGGDDGVVRIWDPHLRTDPGRKLGRHEGVVWSLTATANGCVVSGSEDGVVREWDPTAMPAARRDIGRHEGTVRAVAATPHGRIVSGGAEGVWLWDPARAVDAGVRLGRHDAAVRAVAVDARDRIVSGGWDGIVRLRDPGLGGDPGRERDVPRTEISSVAVTPSGTVVSGHRNGAVRIWATGGCAGPGEELGRHDDWVEALAITPRGAIVSSDIQGVLRLWDPDAGGDRGREIGHHGAWVEALAVTAEGTIVSCGLDGVVRLWDPDAGAVADRELGRFQAAAQAVAVTPSGKLALASGAVVRLCDPKAPGAAGLEIGHHAAPVRAIAVTHDGRIAAGSEDGILRLWDAFRGGDRGRELGRHEGVRAIAVTAGDSLLSAGLDGVVRLWDLAPPGAGAHELVRHDRTVRAVAVTAEGRVALATIGGALTLGEVHRRSPLNHRVSQ